MDTTIVSLVILLILLVVALGWLLLNRQNSLATLEARLAHMGDLPQKLQEQLQRQERELSKHLEDRLNNVTKNVHETLEKGAEKANLSLNDLKERLAVLDSAQKNILDLSTQMVDLHQVLGNKMARGAFGEIQLENLVQQVLPPSAYEFQASLPNPKGGNALRPDCLIQLPNPPGPMVVDAKFPFDSYKMLIEATESEAQNNARQTLGQDVLKHAKSISEKYIIPGSTADSAIMFLPSEAVYAEIHASLPEIVEKCFRMRVWIVSPTTLMATLNTVRAILRDVQLREQARTIQKEVMALLENLKRFDERLDNLKRHFNNAEEDIRKLTISSEKIGRHGENILNLETEENGISLAPPQPSRAEAS